MFTYGLVVTLFALNMSLGTADSQKDEFRKYLEKTGVINQLTRVLVGLYEEPDR